MESPDEFDTEPTEEQYAAGMQKVLDAFRAHGVPETQVTAQACLEIGITMYRDHMGLQQHEIARLVPGIYEYCGPIATTFPYGGPPDDMTPPCRAEPEAVQEQGVWVPVVRVSDSAGLSRPIPYTAALHATSDDAMAYARLKAAALQRHFDAPG